MASENCILCGRPLSEAPTNREHLVPATLIRNLHKVAVPERFSYALRADLRDSPDTDEVVCCHRSHHTTWATIVTHQKCNSDASPMCQDIKHIIDNLDNKKAKYRTDRIQEYYGHIWSMTPDDIEVRLLSETQVNDLLKNEKYMMVYKPGILWAGRLLIKAKLECAIIRQPDYHLHSIFLGEKKTLEQIADNIGRGIDAGVY